MIRGADGRRRCFWAEAAPDYRAYHDDEWGRPVVDDRRLFERLCLEAFQSGLSWLTILRKRDAFREAFAGFEIRAVAAFDDRDIARLLGDSAIVRNRAKIDAAIANASAARALLDGGDSLARLAWSFRRSRGAVPRSRADIPATTPESAGLARALKDRGFRFVGATTVYALMQACGIVNDHLAGCTVRRGVEEERRRALRGFA